MTSCRRNAHPVLLPDNRRQSHSSERVGENLITRARSSMSRARAGETEDRANMTNSGLCAARECAERNPPRRFRDARSAARAGEANRAPLPVSNAARGAERARRVARRTHASRTSEPHRPSPAALHRRLHRDAAENTRRPPLPHPRAGRRPSTDLGEAAGEAGWVGAPNEPATVNVNGKSAKVTSTDGGTPYRFEGVVDLDAGANTVVVEAKDGQNNVATKSYAVTTTGSSKTFEYDANGNLRYEKQPNGTVIREYRWDQQNRLVRAIIGTHESVYEYDGESHRVRIKELTSSVETKNETFVWCGSRICQKRSAATVVRSYFKGGFEQGSDDYFYTRDHLGSVREVVGSDGTTVSGRVAYSFWGEATETGSVLPDFGFTGHYLDRPTGLNLALYRGYSPLLGRWMSRDPIGLRGGRNLYGYVDGDPVNHVDPLGLWKICFPVGLFFEICISGPDKPPPSCKPEPGPPPNPPESCPLVGASPGAPPTCHYRCNSDGHTFDRDGELHGEKVCPDSAER